MKVLLVVGLLIAVVGVVVFLERDFFAETVLHTTTTRTERDFLRLAGDAGEREASDDETKVKYVAFAGGALFFLGAWYAIAGAARRDHPQPPAAKS